MNDKNQSLTTFSNMEYFKIIKPTIQLAPFIKYFVLLSANRQNYKIQRVIPTGSVELILYRRGYSKRILDSNNNPGSFIGGYKSSYVDLQPNIGKIEFISVIFQPYGVKAFLDMPITEIYNNIAGLADLDDRSLNDLYKRIVDSSNIDECVPIIERFLTKKINTNKLHHLDRMLSGVSAISTNSLINVSTLAETLCLSQKQLTRVFQDYIGCNPKEFIRMKRFNRVLNLLKTRNILNFAQIAQECGYSDQSHLIREFKTFSGYTPYEFITPDKDSDHTPYEILTPDTGLHYFT